MVVERQACVSRHDFTILKRFPSDTQTTNYDEKRMTPSTIGKGAACVVLPTDFEQPARRAFMYGVKLATALPARLKIVHVIKTAADSPHAAPESRHLGSRKTSALLNLGRLARMAKEHGSPAQPLLRYGVPALCIVESATQAHADMIVMGTEGRTGWDRLRLGSTAQGVVQAAPCPVLCVHGGVAGDVARHPARVRLHRLLVATDFSSHADIALQVVADLAVKLHAAVCLFHAAQSPEDKPHAERKLTTGVERLRSRHLEVEGHIVQGDPVETILAQAAAWQAEVIAVGTKGRRGLSRVLLGSVARALLQRAGCPVLTVGNVRDRRRGGRPHRR